MYISSILKKHNYDVTFIDLKLEPHYIQKIVSIKPDVIAYSVITGEHQFYKEINKRLKDKIHFFSIFGGAHCTFFPEFVLEEGVDAICIGEGEAPILELIENLNNNQDIRNTKNLWIKQDGKIYKNSVRNLTENIDNLSFPDREMLDKYIAYKKKTQKFLISGRGCPYKCTYCFNHKYNEIYKDKGSIVRKRSIENVISELQNIIKNYHPKVIKFWDDIFIIDKSWTIEFCKEYKEKINLPYRIFVRANLIDEEIANALKESGCITIQIGIEHGNEAQRNSLLKRNLSDDQIVKACSIINKYKIKIISLNMFGLPEQTIEMAYETVSLNVKCKPAYAYSSVFQPYWGTELAEYSIKNNYFDGNINSYYNNCVKDGSLLKMQNIKQLVNFHYLFSIAVKSNLSYKTMNFLVFAPFSYIYKFVFLIHKTWNYVFRIFEINVFDIMYYNISLIKKHFLSLFPLK